MNVKKGGLLEIALNQTINEVGICQTCAYLIKISDTALGCVKHDKFIMPKFPPYYRNCKCKDWEPKEG